ncbi:acyltransferase [Pseudomonas sp. N040]|nr:acyltransferase [Pseudomonas sp. N040]
MAIRNIINRFFLLLIRTYQYCRGISYRCICTACVEGKPICRQPLLMQGGGKVIFSGKVTIGYYPSPAHFSTYAHIEARGNQAVVSIGDGTAINNNFCAIAEHTNISIGENCFIGCNVEILDSDFHGLKVTERNQSKPEWAKPVNINDNVFIGSNAKIMKGVTVGAGAIIANSAVVVKDVPEYAVVAGNPAKVIKFLHDNCDE